MPEVTKPQVVSIIGATGFVGRRLVELILENQPAWRLRLLTRTRQVSGLPGQNDGRLEVVAGDLLKANSLEGLVASGGTVVNLAYLSRGSLTQNLEAAWNLVRVCREKGVKRLVHVSSVSVYGDVPDEAVNEESPCRPQSQYQKNKYRIEQLLAHEIKGAFELMILRPSAIFGARGKNLVKLANDLSNGNRMLNYLKASLFYHRRMNLVVLDNVVAAIVFLINRKMNTREEIFIVSDDDQPDNYYRYVERRLMAVLGLRDYPMPVFPLPQFLGAMALKIFKKGEHNPRRRYLNSKLSSCGYLQPGSFDEGLSSFADWYMQARVTP